MNKTILIFGRIFLIFFLFLLGEKTVYAQSLPSKCFDNQSDYSHMWWLKTIKNENKIFGIKTSRYAFSFDYGNLIIPNLSINKIPKTESEALRESNDESFPAGNACQISFGMTSDSRNYIVQAYSQNIDDCQLIETGKYFQRRFINKLVDLNGCNSDKSGLEISSWPDRFAFILRASPTYDLLNRGLFIDFTFPANYSVLLEKGDIKALKDPNEGSGFIILKSEKTTGLSVTGSTVKANLEKQSSIPVGQEISTGLIIYPIANNIDAALDSIAEQESQPVLMTAEQIAPTNMKLNVTYNKDLGWHEITLRNDGNIADYSESSNNRIERVNLKFDNPSSIDKVVRLNFAKGHLTENGSSVFGITGISAILRDMNGNPVGIPVQLSKNWHTSDSQKDQYFRGPWYHGLSMLTIPANTKINLEYTSVNALWGNVPAASHAQLCLVGWGSNQQWDESAIGSWGESITYEPDLDQAGAPVLDFRPLMLHNLSNQKWSWTGNMGGADFFNYTKTFGSRGWHSRIRTQYKRYSPNLTEVIYAGTMDDNSMDFEYSASVGRSEDIVRGIYHIKLKVLNNVTFKDFVFFQAAASTYHYTKSNTLAWGNETGLKKQWSATIGGTSRYITDKQVAEGKILWFSFTDSQFAGAQANFRPANRGFVIRSWKARINGKDNTSPSFAEFNATGGHGESSSLINITPPVNCTSFQAGDYIDAVIELFQIPKNVGDYYGTNQNLVSALAKKANTWEMVYREAIGNYLDVIVKDGGTLINSYPIEIESGGSVVNFSVTGGRGYVPLKIANVSNYENPALFRKVNGNWQQENQAVYGNDFWQTEYNAVNNSWDITFNVNLDSPNDERQTVEFKFESSKSTGLNPPINIPDFNWKIYPNPNKTGDFNIEMTSLNNLAENKVKIFDLQGRLFFEKDYSSDKLIRVNSNLRSGIYLVSLTNNRSIITQKLAIE
jgi:hypothetical protein